MTVILAAHARRVKNTHYAIEDGSLVLQKHLAILVSDKR